MSASASPANSLSAWVLSDGKAGDELQCLAVTEALGLAAAARRIAPRAPFVWAMPWGPIDPREAPGRPESPIAPPFPDLVVASGRRAVPYLRALKRASGGRAFTVFLKDPRTGTGAADLIWVPAHDALRGPNVVATLTPPHRVTPQKLAEARRDEDPRLAPLPRPRVAILAGGASRHVAFGEADARAFQAGLERLVAAGATPMVTVSRRTPRPLAEALQDLAARSGGFFWDGSGENPYIPLMALADAIVATADSYNMIGEAAASGRPILVFSPAGGHAKHTRFLASLEAEGIVKPFAGRLEDFAYQPLDSTPVIAAAVADGLARHRHALGFPAPTLVGGRTSGS